jgi:hypothetical protein
VTKGISLQKIFESVAISATVAKLLSSQMVTMWQISDKWQIKHELTIF